MRSLMLDIHMHTTKFTDKSEKENIDVIITTQSCSVVQRYNKKQRIKTKKKKK